MHLDSEAQDARDRRTWIAATVLAGMIANEGAWYDRDDREKLGRAVEGRARQIATAVQYADELMAALEKRDGPD